MKHDGIIYINIDIIYINDYFTVIPSSQGIAVLFRFLEIANRIFSTLIKLQFPGFFEGFNDR